MTTEVDCQPCDKIVNAVHVTGSTIYPHRPDLSHLTLLQCPCCKNYVSYDDATQEPRAWITDAAGRRERMEKASLIRMRVARLMLEEATEHELATAWLDIH